MTVVGPFTQNILDNFEPWLAQDVSGQLRAYLVALATPYDVVAQIVSDQGFPDDPDYVPGWSTLLDPDTCPTQFLPFLAQFNGTTVWPGTDDATARSIIKAEAGFKRGTPEAMQAAAKRNLTGTQFMIFRERTGADGQSHAYHVLIAFLPNECPSVQALVDAVEAVKPAGIQITYVNLHGYTWNLALRKWQDDGAITWIQSYATQP